MTSERSTRPSSRSSRRMLIRSHPPVIVAEYHVIGVAFRPTKAQSPLFVHANAVLSFSIAAQCLQPIARWDAQKVETGGAVDQVELSFRADRHVRRHRFHELPQKK